MFPLCCSYGASAVRSAPPTPGSAPTKARPQCWLATPGLFLIQRHPNSADKKIHAAAACCVCQCASRGPGLDPAAHCRGQVGRAELAQDFQIPSEPTPGRRFMLRAQTTTYRQMAALLDPQHTPQPRSPPPSSPQAKQLRIARFFCSQLRYYFLSTLKWAGVRPHRPPCTIALGSSMGIYKACCELFHYSEQRRRVD